ncbi:GAF domain-containing protein [Roseomonas sp. 18066]|uniref:GAF domain-containing protein n=1 Tax=Roseomonas sp. 18066 TaxID=2681412 RepID=UPI0013596BD5|nr:GAF domain-containing protein [Roseomonas sp. 18066]
MAIAMKRSHDLPSTVPDAAEAARLAALDDYAVLDTPPEPAFDGIVQLAARLCATPVALVSLVAEQRQWFKARIGVEACETPIGQAVCAHAIRGEGLLVIPDMTLDPRTRDNPLVTGAPGMRFYAGAPLRNRTGQALGTLCVIDLVPRPAGLTAEQAFALEALAAQVMALLDLRGEAHDRGRIANAARRANAAASERAARSEAGRLRALEAEARARIAQEAGGIGTFEMAVASGRMQVSAEFCRLFGLPELASCDAAVLEALVLPADRARRSSDASRRDGSAEGGVEYRIHRADDGALRWLSRRSAFRHDAAGQVVAMFGTVHDITERKLDQIRLAAKVALGDALRDATTDAEVLRAATATLGDGLGALRAGYAEIDLRAGTALLHQDWVAAGVASLAGPRSLAGFATLVARLAAGQVEAMADSEADPALAADRAGFAAMGVRAQVTVPLRRRGELTAALFVQDGQPRRWSQGEIDFARGVADRCHAALDRLRTEAAQAVLNHELSHRLKNSLTMVQAIAAQTLRGVAPRAPVEALESRIQALGAAHAVLLQQQWRAARIDAVIDQVTGLIGQRDRIVVGGPELALGPRCALAFSLLLHELGTNALKYGALSTEGGRVALSWAVRGEGAAAELVVTWQESGGPPVAPPTERGFGSMLIRRGLLGEGGTQLDFLAEGLRAELAAPLDEVRLG